MRLIFLFLVLLTPYIYSQDDTEQKIGIANEYFNNNEFDKARALYEDLLNDNSIITIIHDNYFSILLQDRLYRKAEQYINRVVSSYPQNYEYRVDEILLYYQQKDTAKGEKIRNILFDEIIDNKYQTRLAATIFIQKQLIDDAIALLLKSRSHWSEQDLYALDLANIYRATSQTSLMLDEYINYALTQEGAENYVIRMLGNSLQTNDDLDLFERKLYQVSQKNAGNNTISELLIWTQLQKGNYYGAFIQARSIDRRNKSNGQRSLEIGLIALNNKDYENAIRIFEYVSESFPNTINYLYAKRYLINAREAMVKNTLPVDKDEIQKLIDSYDALITEVGYKFESMDIIKDKANLYAFYLNDLEEAVKLLNFIIRSGYANQRLTSECKMMLGDIYLLKKEPWESALIYAQVEKALNDSPLAYEAKLKLAKLYYYKSEFKLAKDNLDILKQAAQRDIANDAIELSLLIQDNYIEDIDSLNQALTTFADIDLLLFENKTEQALLELNTFEEKYPQHSLIDEVYFRQAEILTKKGEYELAKSKYEYILENYSYDILADDAQFAIAEIYEYFIRDKQMAMDAYEKILTNHAGSIFTAEARKKYRKLRGDILEPDL